MKTYEGIMTIKWHKNDAGDRRPITIDVENTDQLCKELNRIREEFNTKGDDPECAFYKAWHGDHIPPHRITFEINERK